MREIEREMGRGRKKEVGREKKDRERGIERIEV